MNKNAGGELCLCETASSCASGFGTRKASEQGGDNNGDGNDDIYIMMQCVSVCNEK